MSIPTSPARLLSDSGCGSLRRRWLKCREGPTLHPSPKPHIPGSAPGTPGPRLTSCVSSLQAHLLPGTLPEGHASRPRCNLLLLSGHPVLVAWLPPPHPAPTCLLRPHLSSNLPDLTPLCWAPPASITAQLITCIIITRLRPAHHEAVRPVRADHRPFLPGPYPCMPGLEPSISFPDQLQDAPPGSYRPPLASCPRCQLSWLLPASRMSFLALRSLRELTWKGWGGAGAGRRACRRVAQQYTARADSSGAICLAWVGDELQRVPLATAPAPPFAPCPGRPTHLPLLLRLHPLFFLLLVLILLPVRQDSTILIPSSWQLLPLHQDPALQLL